MKKYRLYLLLFNLLLFSCSQEPGTYNVSSEVFLLVPLGNKISPTFTTILLNDNIPFQYTIETDDYGNAWAGMPLTGINYSSTLTIQYTIKKQNNSPYEDITARTNLKWLESSYFIDWKDKSIVAVAKELDLYSLSRIDAVKIIGDYILKNTKYAKEDGIQPAAIPASRTLAAKLGICINRSRLFVAICRASGIPARTVSGIVRNHGDPNTYDFHHEWMEYLDEKGFWHAVDLRYTKSYELNDPRYAGFVYGAEDHLWFSELDNKTLQSGQPLQLLNGNIILFHYHPIFKGARYGFNLIDSKDMEYYVIEKNLQIKKKGKQVTIEQSLEL